MAAWVFLGLVLFMLGILAIGPIIVSKKVIPENDKGFDQKSEEPLPEVPPYLVEDQVQFMNGGDKLAHGFVLEAYDDPQPNLPVHQMVVIKHFVDYGGRLLPKETRVSSRKVILVKRLKKV
ncbi:MAG: hypothetical protein A2931_02170 [Candidatus Niyogibacteria bacterium RIFCSPLOWO2_01_FULL_45_48]|uniref:Uncharacterized protein n=2 Tax=Candidatus Niyogiibacteriota TaxID=1817912 RepID=A0A1G2EXY2_9BACT|nr:MAG: hypothetical protein A2835_00245 [Candidatus Niyogibacteria bacterium RIFCSPHIGHO2_01_FULL_45_28]OGZ28413.1 MAG: hypothetical protein A2835_00260 [Candidatus Niyogibacteria bacterium RIFCSPHIGHO2_01_FULL_45_28]OGZ29968.1 MAG: hypothetical protein A2931_02170 [Candidatus Niyogibacteria bacterium RIFCSPLOWO2_01_FULL_45_48]OGZ30372.1 MAG: hypothetical protein A3J00_02900 [Candidatus Niyogibacteria bacterium RIFCSPLOWO2_02_FULL_45_13]